MIAYYYIPKFYVNKEVFCIFLKENGSVVLTGPFQIIDEQLQYRLHYM